MGLVHSTSQYWFCCRTPVDERRECCQRNDYIAAYFALLRKVDGDAIPYPFYSTRTSILSMMDCTTSTLYSPPCKRAVKHCAKSIFAFYAQKRGICRQRRIKLYAARNKNLPLRYKILFSVCTTVWYILWQCVVRGQHRTKSYLRT